MFLNRLYIPFGYTSEQLEDNIVCCKNQMVLKPVFTTTCMHLGFKKGPIRGRLATLRALQWAWILFI